MVKSRRFIEIFWILNPENRGLHVSFFFQRDVCDPNQPPIFRRNSLEGGGGYSHLERCKFHILWKFPSDISNVEFSIPFLPNPSGRIRWDISFFFTTMDFPVFFDKFPDVQISHTFYNQTRHCIEGNWKSCFPVLDRISFDKTTKTCNFFAFDFLDLSMSFLGRQF